MHHKFLISIIAGVLVSLFMSSCEAEREPMLQEYTWRDSIIEYVIYSDSLVLSFPEQPQESSWDIEMALYADSNNREVFDAYGSYEVVNKKITIPVLLADTINVQQLKIWLAAGPNDGLRVTKEDGYYQPYGQVRYWPEGTNRLKAAPWALEQEWLIIPDRLFEGKDSLYYNDLFVKFLADSCTKPQHVY